jgi:hypothetical protein
MLDFQALLMSMEGKLLAGLVIMMVVMVIV